MRRTTRNVLQPLCGRYCGGIGLLFVGLMTIFFSAGCTKYEMLNAVVPKCGYELTENIAYGDNHRQKLDIYNPTSAGEKASGSAGASKTSIRETASEREPTSTPVSASTTIDRPVGQSNGRPGVVIFFYGGDWQAGARGEYRFVGQALASHGYVAVLPDYRLFPEVRFPAFVEDGARVVRWVVDHADQIGADPTRIFLMGHSAGAHIAALLALDPHYLQDVGLHRQTVRGAALLSGPFDFVPPGNDRDVFNMRPDQLLAAGNTQPVNFVDEFTPPLLIIHGLDDTIVDPQNSRELVDRLQSADASYRAIFYKNKDHVAVALALAWPFRWVAPTLPDCLEFFDEVSR